MRKVRILIQIVIHTQKTKYLNDHTDVIFNNVSLRFVEANNLHF